MPNEILFQIISRNDCFNSFISEVQPITKGVPQGGVLGHLLFNVYINNLVNISNAAEIVIYAVDTSTFISGKKTNQAADASITILRNLQTWANSNRLKINVPKTKVLFFRPRNKPIY